MPGIPVKDMHGIANSHSFRPTQQVSFFVDIGLDDSYTPQKISIRAGTFYGDLQEVRDPLQTTKQYPSLC